MSLRQLVLVGIVMELCYLSFYCVAEGAGEVLLFIAVNVATFLLLSLIVWQMRRAKPPLRSENRIAQIILGMGLLFRVTLVPHGVVGSDDIYRYLWDGRVATSGINPFLYLPTDPHLSHLVTTDLPSKVNHPELHSVYPAVAQALFFVSYKIFGESAPGLKFLLVVVDCLTMLLLEASPRPEGLCLAPCSVCVVAASHSLFRTRRAHRCVGDSVSYPLSCVLPDTPSGPWGRRAWGGSTGETCPAAGGPFPAQNG